MMPGTARPPSFVQRHQLATYFGLTFAISWAIWLVLILGSLHIQTPVGAALNIVAIAGPSIAALVLAIVLGRSELRCLLAGFSLSRWSVRWTVVALVLPLAMMAAAIAVSVAAFGAPRPAVTFSLAGVWYGWLRLSSGSIWPVCLSHSAFNNVMESLAGVAIVRSAATMAYVTTETGVVTMVITVLVAAFLLLRKGADFDKARPGAQRPTIEPRVEASRRQ